MLRASQYAPEDNYYPDLQEQNFICLFLNFVENK